MMEIKLNKKYEIKSLQKISQNRINAIMEYIEKGVPARYAVGANGIAETTFYQWIKQGKLDLSQELNTLHATLVQSLSKFHAFDITECIKKIDDDGARGAMWKLEHKYWKDFSSAVAEKEISEKLSQLESERENDDGEEVDSEDAHEKRGVTRGVARPKGKKDSR